MARDGVWRKLDAALTWHPEDVNEVETGSSNSCIQAQYKFTGVASHAAGAPEKGRSALDAVELMNIGVQFLREHMSDRATNPLCHHRCRRMQPERGTAAGKRALYGAFQSRGGSSRAAGSGSIGLQKARH